MFWAECQGYDLQGECPNTQLKEVKERKWHSNPWMFGAITFFLNAKAIVCLNKNCQNCLEILQFSRKTSASPCQCRDIMAQIGVDTFHRESVIFVVYIVDVLPWIHYIQVSLIAICAIIFCLWSRIYHPLDRFRHFIPARHMAQDLPWLSAHHCHNVDIFPRFCPGFILQIPVQLIQFHNFCPLCGYFFSLPLFGLFLSNLPHWICSSPEFSLRRVH